MDVILQMETETTNTSTAPVWGIIKLEHSKRETKVNIFNRQQWISRPSFLRSHFNKAKGYYPGL